MQASEQQKAKLSPFEAFLQQELRLSEDARKARQQAEDYIKFQAQVLSQVNDAIIAIDDRRCITYCNRKAEQLLSFKTERVLGRTLEEACHYRWLKPEDEQAAFDCLAATGSWQGENILVKVNGEEIYVESSLSVLKDDCNRAIGLLSVIRDITQRKRAEQKIYEQAALLDIATDAILVRGLDNQILFWNKGAEGLYGWKAQEVVAKNANELLYEETSPQLEEAFETVIETSAWQGELHQVTKQGKKIIVFSRWTLMRDEQQQPKSILTVNTDITEKKQLEAQLWRAGRLESIGSLAGGIAHDLNNLLAPILMIAQLLETQLHDERSQRLLPVVVTNAKRGASLVKQVLSFSRGLEGERTLLQVRHLIAEVQQIAQETFPKNIEFLIDISPNLWAVYGDATQLHQVLMNLVINARDAMPSGGTLSICAENLLIDENYAQMNRDAAVGSYIFITVTDTGVGIPAQIESRIFEAFFTTKEPGIGTGLGLSTVMSIIKSLGGFIKMHTQVGQGTQFQVYLPAAEGTQTQLAEDIELALGNGELILVVDDEAAIREIIKASLETYQYQVLTASDGIEAISLYVQHQDRISAVVMDMLMPQMDGLTTIRTLQKINPQVKIIATSGLAFSQEVRFAIGTGANALLSKPYTAPNLLQTLHSVLNTK
ncbi:PAS domain S-box protein [Chroococcidiopsis sp. SAG 2025]|uniref:PAS domain-containing hybrid sensor histidine kinase/response regulator n=1 Tax=Chroococcidiopsis sp. SAG 2025 TaxID=171389 RepID=UPI0039778F26